MIYLIGDSHVQAVTGPNFKKIHLNAPTAYQNYKKIYEIESHLKTYSVDKLNDYLFFSFGEIDVRCHLGFIADKNNRSYDDVVSECANRYSKFLDNFIENNYRVGVYGVIPSGPNNGIQGNGAASYKTKDDRNKITKLLNTKLQEICFEKNILFKTVFDIIIQDTNNYSNYFSNDNIHLNCGMFKTHENNINCEQLIINQFKELI